MARATACTPWMHTTYLRGKERKQNKKISTWVRLGCRNHGVSVEEVLGDDDGEAWTLSFSERQAPGAEAFLEIRIDPILGGSSLSFRIPGGDSQS